MLNYTAFIGQPPQTPTTTTPESSPDDQSSENPTPSQPDDDWFAQLESQHQLWDQYYHCCGSW